jgi:Domain of unknown function (DUF5916)/Carbohydrate family 9 binding domain-like
VTASFLLRAPRPEICLRLVLTALAGVLSSYPLVARAEGPLPPDPRYQVQVPRLRAAPVIDGRLDDAAWSEALVLEPFTQMEPKDGAPAVERTTVRLGYDTRALYVAFRCESTEASPIVGAAMNRDAFLENEDHVEIAIDTFLDHQNAFLFMTNPAGARVDGTIRDDGEDVRYDWDAVWSVATSRDERGWTAEFAIPFAALRFPEGESATFGINFARFAVGSHELSFWRPLHYARGIFSSRYRVSGYGEISGMSGLQRENLFTLKPYVLLGVDRPAQTDPSPLRQGGLDLKVPLTSGLVADFTVNPDFADAEADEQQLNLTRFPLLYPEKRDFFKEGAALFYFGDRQVDTSNETFEQFNFFQSRQIGLAQGGQVAVPVIGGARITGKVGSLGIGLLNLTTSEVHDGARGIEAPLFNDTVLRLQQEFSGGSTLGVMGLDKQGGDGSYNRGLGADFNLVATDWLRFGGYGARTFSPGLSGDDLAGSFDVLLQGEHLGLRALYTDIGANFNPELGYLTRPGIRKVQVVPTVTGSPDFWGIKHATLFYDFNFVMDRDWRLLTRLQKGELLVFFNNGYAFAVIPAAEHERLDQPFNVYGSTVIPAGSYDFKSLFVGFGTDIGAPLALITWLDGGQFYGGTRFRARFNVFARGGLPGLLFHGIYDRTQVSLPWGDFTSHILSAVTTYSFSPSLSTRATVQYSSDDSLRVNLLLDWEYLPGMNAFVLFNRQKDLLGGRPWLDNLTGALKLVWAWGLPSRAAAPQDARALLVPGTDCDLASGLRPRGPDGAARALDTCGKAAP